MTDIVEKIGEGSLIHHGKQSDRIYLMKLDIRDATTIIDMLAVIAETHQYTKVLCKIPQKAAPLFVAGGYAIEGYVPGFYNGTEDALFVSRFLTTDRFQFSQQQGLHELARLLKVSSLDQQPLVQDRAGYSIRLLEKADVEAMVEIYSEVFESYPFPIHDTSYLLQTMEGHVQYFGAFKEGKLAALSSAEIDFESKNAEMTDFATHRLHTGHHLSALLLQVMEQALRPQGILTLFSIARVNSLPMNKTFLRLGYSYSGTLINNTQICGTIESMNIYYKQL